MPASRPFFTTGKLVLFSMLLLAGSGLFLTTLACVAFAFVQQRAVTPPATLIVENDVPYATVDGQTLHVDIARPKTGNGPFPALVFVHGGGWLKGDKSVYRTQMYNMAQQGYVTVSVQYRLVPKATFPAQIQDVKAAVRYVRSRALELNINPNAIGAVGGSAGGHLVLLLATTDTDTFPKLGGHLEESDAVQAVVSLAGPTDLTAAFPKASEWMVTGLVGQSREAAADNYRDASPLHYVGKGDAPILMIHGTKDELVPYEQATALLAAYEKQGLDAALHTIPDGTHGGGGKPADLNASVVRMVRFLEKHLKRETRP